jgi:adenosylhomocysteine nucleosidase
VKYILVDIAFALVLLTTTGISQDRAVGLRPVLVQGALRLETEYLIAQLSDIRSEQIGVWTFWNGTIDGYPVIVSKTRMGGVHSAAATAVAIEHYQPIGIINQGTAGGHDPELKVYDIVLGTKSINIGEFKTPHRILGAGSNALDWIPLNLMEFERGADDALHEHTVACFPADSVLLIAALSIKDMYKKGRVVKGVIASSDVWNEEIDRIKQFHDSLGTSVEEMETAPAAQIAYLYGIPFLGIRIVTANIVTDEIYDPSTGRVCQEFVIDAIKAYIKYIKQSH